MNNLAIEQLRSAPASEILKAARADFREIKLIAAEPPMISLVGSKPSIERWRELFRLRKSDLVAELQANGINSNSDDQMQHEIVFGDDIKTCPSCGSIIAPEPRIQVENYKLWQRSQPQVAWWSDSELARLEATLEPGDLIIFPSFYQSCTIKRASGAFDTFPRNQA